VTDWLQVMTLAFDGSATPTPPRPTK